MNSAIGYSEGAEVPEDKTKSFRSFQYILELKEGDIVRSKSTKTTYMVTANYGSRATAVRTQDITNPSEWEVFELGSLKNKPI